MRYRTVRFQPNTWRARIGLVFATAVALALAAAFIVLSLGLAIVLLPLVAVLFAVGWWRWRKIEAALREEQAARGDGDAGRVIEIDYRVVDPDTAGRR